MQKTTFVPSLVIAHGITDISFYTNAFGAIELHRWTNDDGSIHVAELEIDGAMFHLQEEREYKNWLRPGNKDCTTVGIELMVEDVHAVFNKAIAAGATLVTEVTDYEYNYRQGELIDPFGHHWIIEKILKRDNLK